MAAAFLKYSSVEGAKVGKPGNKIRIPLSEKKALAGLLAVKPSADMPKRAQLKRKATTGKQRKSTTKGYGFP
jgi:hypothetical protein